MSPASTTDRVQTLLSTYSVTPGVFDETLDGGQVRPHWQKLLEHLDALGADELQRRCERAQRQMFTDGITYSPRDIGGGGSRPWMLDVVPLLLTQQQWDPIAEGLIQRARLYEVILGDLFGPQQLLRDRLLPPEALFGHPCFHPPYHGLTPPTQRYLQLFAADLSRDAQGDWMIVGDRTSAPFGLGYLLENRIAASRMLPKAFRTLRVQRLAPFFIALRETLRGLALRSRDNPRIVLWTRGPSSPSYFEDAYLARYLGYTLAEGNDLAVRENSVMLKTLGGLLPIEVLFRRLVDDDCDPVELAIDSADGVSGLVEVLRSRNVAICNGLGSRLVESPIFLPYLDQICRQRLGQPLKLPSVQTWWCGVPEALSYVIDNFDRLRIRSAYLLEDNGAIDPARLSAEQRRALQEKVLARPADYVAQQPVVRSTAPVWNEGQLQAWPVALRGFVVSSHDDYCCLPGGLSRVAPDALALEQSMSSGERSQDVWILSDQPVKEVSLLKAVVNPTQLRRTGDDFPSRVADNLFWLGRNVERAEAQARLLRTVLLRLTDEHEHLPELPVLVRALAERGQVEPDYVVEGLQRGLPSVIDVLPQHALDATLPMSLRATIDEVVRIASTVRDRVAIDMWRIIRRIDETSRSPAPRRQLDAFEVLPILDQVITELVALAGLAADSMTRTQAWRFLDLGRRIERAWQTSVLCRATLVEVPSEESAVLEAVLVTLDSIMTYRSRYMASMQPAPVLDLLLTDETNPRSIAFQLVAIAEHVDRLPRDPLEAVRSPEQRTALAMLNMVRLSDVFELAKAEGAAGRIALNRLLTRLDESLPKLADAVSSRFLIHAGLQRHYASRQGLGP